MFSRLIVAAVVGALTSTAATAASVSLSLVNQTSRTVTSISAYPIDGSGNVVEDNLGGHYDPIPANASAAFTLSGDCGEILLVIAFEGGGEHRTQFNSCETKRLTLKG